MSSKHVLLSSALVLLLSACSKPTLELGPDADAQGHSAPTEYTAAANARVLEERPFADEQDFADAQRGLMS